MQDIKKNRQNDKKRNSKRCSFESKPCCKKFRLTGKLKYDKSVFRNVPETSRSKEAVMITKKMVLSRLVPTHFTDSFLLRGRPPDKEPKQDFYRHLFEKTRPEKSILS